MPLALEAQINCSSKKFCPTFRIELEKTNLVHRINQIGPREGGREGGSVCVGVYVKEDRDVLLAFKFDFNGLVFVVLFF